MKALIQFLSLLFTACTISGQSQISFDSQPLLEKGDLSAQMVEGINRFLTKETERVRQTREGLWMRDFSSPEVFNQSIMSQREFLVQRSGAVDIRVLPSMEVGTNHKLAQFRVETETCVIRPVTWNVLAGLSAEGLLLQPKGKTWARVILIPDADVLPEVLAGLQKQENSGYFIAQQLANAGCEVLIPLLVNRKDTFSGNPMINRFTNQPHREWIYRQGFEVGRHIIGYELQKIFAAIDWMESRNHPGQDNLPIGVAGHGEGGLLALYATAIDTRISSTLVSGYFKARENMWREPIYRNIFGLLKYFGDAELAVMSWPRPLVIEYASVPEILGPPPITEERSGAAPGGITTPGFSTVMAEINRANEILPKNQSHILLVPGDNESPSNPFSYAAISKFSESLNLNLPDNFGILPQPLEPHDWIDTTLRQQRTVLDIERHVQKVVQLCERTRYDNFWKPLEGDTDNQKALKSVFREQFWNQIGLLPTPSLPISPHSRLLEETEKWTSYEIKLDVWPDVYAWGILIIPKDLKPGEKRPVVVCQHGLEGLPVDIVSTDPLSRKFKTYKGLATRLAEHGYVTFAPHNPYRGEDKFRVLQRKANPLGLSLFSVITGQHQQIVKWLGGLSFVDPRRIGFYGLSYGGKSAMRIPALVEGYSLSICSGDFNEWVKKNASVDYGLSYMFHGEYEMPEWDLGHTFNYAEMAGLIAPRPFMVERGHFDGVGMDEWVGYEYAKVRRHYDLIGLPGNCRIEYFNAGHMINGIGTFEFLDQHLMGTGEYLNK